MSPNWFLYSQAGNLFLNKVHHLCKKIMTEEMGLTFFRRRFEWKDRLIPLYLVLFEKSQTLGFFDHHHFQIGLHKKFLLRPDWEIIKNVLRHELAHLYTFLLYGSEILPHGKEFKNVCQQFSWGDEVSAPTLNFEEIDIPKEHDKVVQKIQKLLSLSSSSNPHEAEQAALKANQLLLKHHLSQESFHHNEEQEICMMRVLEGRKSTEKWQTIYEILQTFYVAPVFNYARKKVYLEVTGLPCQLEVAHYVTQFLDTQLEELWKKAKKENPHLRGVRCKKSFMRGIAQGYQEKYHQLDQPQNYQKAIVQSQALLKQALPMVYPKLSSLGRNSGKSCPESRSLGQKAGKDLSIHRPVTSKTGPTLALSQR